MTLPRAIVAHYNKHGLILISAWIINYIHYNVWGEITYLSRRVRNRLRRIENHYADFVRFEIDSMEIILV